MADKWRIWDSQAKAWASADYTSRSRARARADRLDNEYGAYRYFVKPIEIGPGAASTDLKKK